ncbi:Drug/metabolite transporter [Corchorus olitorius]|uniref:Drug/metabolite transporter n=1 Tax=Corchorus olitorius TaxID=93759 RepID=A0A1R3K6P4_9ROSI|nr:Drug/metabolite transporter [Corchorus olitorius]
MENYGFYAAMVVVQLAYGGSNILIKIAIERGLNQFVFVVYRHLIALFFLGPLAYVFERKKRPSLSVSVFGKIFLLSSLGTTIHLNVYYAGLAYTSPTVATALSNIIPSLTFLMAILLRMEKLNIKSGSGKAKILGTIICIGGSLIFTFWRGGFQFKGIVNKPLIEIYSRNNSQGEFSHESWIKGSVLILVSYIAWSGWLILQATVSKVYPAQLSLNVIICFIASLQSSILALFFARNPLLWKLDWNVQLLTIIYCGVVLSALAYYLQTWCISNKGPVFAAMFIPLVVVFVAIFSAIFFAERLHLGRGLNQFVFIAYRHIIATLFLGPFAYVLEREGRPSLSFSLFAKIFLLSSMAITYYSLFFLGLTYTSPTIASALSNISPSLTFLMAVLLRMERVKIRSASGQAKVFGTIICFAGSLVLTLWKGGYQLKGIEKRPLINIYGTNGSTGQLRHGKENWLKGSCLVLISTVAFSGWMILQGTVSKAYPAQLSLNALICFIASLQSSLVAVSVARNPDLWKLDWNVQLLTIIYSGVVATALTYYIQTWCIRHKGPVFVSSFSPLCAVMVAIFSAIAFAERLHLGSLLGAFLIIAGLYIVLWGKKSDTSETGNENKNEFKSNMPEISENDSPATTDKSIASQMKC